MRYAIILLLLTCQACASVPELYVDADRATFDAVAPEYTRYIESDADLDDGQKDRRLRTLDTWERRIQAAEEGLEK